ncbi:hypothetical protein DAPPUDRAFT_262825 [Daphnia pulex]|uniref:Reverse transcriptase domain-containing protein n=1 Tax=Daphnia pulex TaxID=6669 RepID=E9HNR7_DAPPU|nr:hypothetical protein DAPPUDRAFT_262825 [Daphnia pulex]|eukprot:EFX66601.1 hypothetical protein DAPPUDRAFT_262825 [Daphnia pulex]
MCADHYRLARRRRFISPRAFIAQCKEDIIIFSRTFEENIRLLRLLFCTADEHNVSFNKKKTVLASLTGVFVGYVVSENGFCPNHALTQAIREFLQPSNLTDLRSFVGLCQQVGNFSTKIAAALVPLAPLLKKTIAWD